MANAVEGRLAPPWIIFCDGGEPVAILPAGRPGEVADVRGIPRTTVEAIVNAANERQRATLPETMTAALELATKVITRDREEREEAIAWIEAALMIAGEAGRP